mmetsp:Transcript_27592/g.60871  ORF Transcript_27592/g.60871 Transcript_27592/m.60871 type:complete len:342 (-) Transcript_27592:182-1207(-)
MTTSQSHRYMAHAQMLNNAASLSIKNGDYDGAISSLESSLRLWEVYIMIENKEHSHGADRKRREYTIDECIAYSESQNHGPRPCRKSTRIFEESSRVHSASSCGNKRRRIAVNTTKLLDKVEYQDREDSNAATNRKFESRHFHLSSTGCSSDRNNRGFIYQYPILIPEVYHMGATSFFVILFNLALANHFNALSARGDENDKKKSEKGNGSARKVLLIYEMIFEYWSRIQNRSGIDRDDLAMTGSIRFVMILYNNLSQMYGMVHNHTKQRQCLQNLLSTVMIAVECKTRITNSSFVSVGVARPIGTQDTNSTHCNEDTLFQESINGFLTNAMPEEQCAQAA